MWKQLKSLFREHPRKRRINMSKEKDYEYLLHALRILEQSGPIYVDESDILQLKCGEAVFLYESPLAASAEEAIAMVKRVMKKMRPAPNRVLLLTVLTIIAGDDLYNLDLIEQLASPLTEEAFSEDTDVIFGTQFSDEKGIRFVMATAEGKRGSKPFCVNDSQVAPGLDQSETSNGGEIEMREAVSPSRLSNANLFDAAVEMVLATEHITVAMLQRRLNLSYSYTVRLIDKMEMLGIVSAPNGPMPRQLRMPRTKWEEIRLSHHAGKSVYGQRQDDFQIENGCLTKYKGGGGDVVLPEGIKEIGQDAFSHCTGLTGIYIPDGAAKIGAQAFWGCTHLKRVSLPTETILEIGLFAFQNCTGLTEFQIPRNVTKINWGVFDHCASLKWIVIPDLVVEICGNPFVGCTSLTLASVHVMPGNNVFSIQEGALLRDDGKELICCPTASGEYHIPESVVRIGPDAFRECRDLTGIIIPEGVKEIGDYAFRRCTGLTEVTIPSSVEEVGECAFQECEKLTSLTIRDGAKKIGTCAFDGTGLTGSLSDFLPQSVMELGAHVFPFYCCGGGKRRPGTDQFID